MYLKSLELQGFKSFPDKTVLSFGQGVTAIVGPNGSGKSNIADAIRWVLGEQSTKALRGAKMEDVIFGGTQNRGPVGYAEVSLILDNSCKTLPIDAAEIMVTRRYYRSGESEYYINRTTVRLKDIHELFMDTGLGRDGYSIIGQGRIDEILSVKSSDRREIFEEAAGISKFRYRKEESERKLQSTEANLVRINDKIAELELSVEPLRVQSETATQYLIYRDELRMQEVSVWMENLDRLKADAEDVRSKYKHVSEQLETEKSELDKLYKLSEELSEQIQSKDLDVEALRSALDVSEHEYSDVESEIAVLKTSLSNINENIERIEREATEQTGRAQSLEEQIADNVRISSELELKIDEADKALAQIEEESAKLLDSDGELTEKADALGVRSDHEDSVISEFLINRKSIESSSEELTRRSDVLSSNKIARASDVEQYEAEVARINELLNNERERAESLKNVISGYELRLENRRKKLTAANDLNTKLRMEQNALDSRIKLLSDMKRDYEGFSAAVKNVMRESERGNLSGIRGPLSMLIKTEDEHALAIETALGAGMQNIVVASERDAKAAIELLKRRDGGRATFLPISAIRGRVMSEDLTRESGFVGVASDLVKTDPEYLDIVRSSLGRTAVADDMDSAIAIARKFSYRFRIVTLDGQVVNAGGSMTGGSSGRNTGVLSRANELENLKKNQTSLVVSLKESDSALSELKRETVAAEYETDVAKADQRKAEDAVLKLEGELSTAYSKAEDSRRTLNAIESELSDIKARTSQNDITVREINDKIELHTAERDRIRKEIELVKGGKTELIAKRGNLTERAALHREAKSGLVAERQTTLKSIDELEKLREHFSSDMIRRSQQIEDYHARCTEIEKEISRLRSKADTLKEANIQKRGKITELTSARMDLEAKRISADRSGKDKNTTILNLQHEQSRLEQKKTEADMSEKQLVDKLWDNYELTRTTATVVAVKLSSVSASTRRIAELRREMSKLGDVNIGAIDEYKRVFERYTYLTDQRDDVERSKKDLEEIIYEITKQMTEIFAERFKDINASFTETFKEIFGGGNAHLELEDETDILNCGIEIRVQPPGKSLKTITLLSGGEKAFVAIALYFAILKVRPTPFCVLDEIEAALDDVNVIRYAKYLKRLCGTTQFILITHRRGTMEESDVLYGVTMQTSGISKILTLNINEAERELGIKLK